MENHFSSSKIKTCVKAFSNDLDLDLKSESIDSSVKLCKFKGTIGCTGDRRYNPTKIASRVLSVTVSFVETQNSDRDEALIDLAASPPKKRPLLMQRDKTSLLDKITPTPASLNKNEVLMAPSSDMEREQTHACYKHLETLMTEALGLRRSNSPFVFQGTTAYCRKKNTIVPPSAYWKELIQSAVKYIQDEKTTYDDCFSILSYAVGACIIRWYHAGKPIFQGNRHQNTTEVVSHRDAIAALVAIIAFYRSRLSPITGNAIANFLETQTGHFKTKIQNSRVDTANSLRTARNKRKEQREKQQRRKEKNTSKNRKKE